MEDAVLKLERRTVTGGRKLNRLRKTGYVPAVVYGKEMKSTPVMVKESELRELLDNNRRHALIGVTLEEQGDFPVIIKDIQYDMLKNKCIHVDFQRVSMTEKIQVDIPIRVTGRDNIDRKGGVLVHQVSELTVECLPQDVPEYIEADVSDLSVGQSLTAGQLKLPERVTLINDDEDIILSITSGKMEVDAEGKDEAEPAESGLEAGAPHNKE